MEQNERERIARDTYERLSPRERRERFVLSPRYRLTYNRIVDSEDRMTLPRYFRRKWLPILGGDAAWLYLVLRDMAQVEAKGSDSWCWPDQADLGRRIAVSRKPLRRALGVLESHGFIRSSRRREPLPGSWQEVQGTNHYEVFLDIPLVAEDAVRALVEEMSEQAAPSEFQFDAQRADSENAALRVVSTPRSSEGQFDLQKGEGIRRVSSSEVRSDPPNVINPINFSNVRETDGKRTPFHEHPVVKRMSGAQKRERERLALEIGDALHRMSGVRDAGPHKSLGFHRRVAFLLDPTLVLQALGATRDAMEERRAGRRGVRLDAGAFFGGIVKELAREHGIDLGLSQEGRFKAREGAGEPAPREGDTSGVAVTRKQHPETARALPGALPSDEERARVKKILGEFFEKHGSRPTGA